LHLLLVRSRADDEVVGEGGYAGKVEDYDVGGLFRFGGADGNQPGRRNGLGGGGFLAIGLGQSTLLTLSYYARTALTDIRRSGGDVQILA
jgi:hypothetical protein